MAKTNGFGHILPIGTKVVTRVDVAATSAQPAFARGAVGVVVAQPVDGHHNYRIRLVDDQVGTFRREQITTLKTYQRGADSAENLLAEYDLHQHVAYRCIVGSRAYGLNHEGSDTDQRGFYLPPARLHWSLFGVPEQLEDKESDTCFWEIQKFLHLAMKANPNILECLYTPLVVEINEIGERLLEIRQAFLSKLAYQTYSGYVLSQFKLMERRRRTKPDHRNNKHAMHLIRLLLSGIELFRNGNLMVSVGDHRDNLLAIRHDEWSDERIETWRSQLLAEFEHAHQSTHLPERPDYDRVNEFLIEARRWAARE